MIIQPNERKLVKKENRRVKEYVWNRTNYPITVYHTSKGIEINSIDIRSIFRKPKPIQGSEFKEDSD